MNHGLGVVARLLCAGVLSFVAWVPSGPVQGAPAPAAPGVVVFPGDGAKVWRASGDLRRLRGTSPDFRAFVKHRLDRLWHGYLESNPVCARSPLVSVQVWSRDGFARISNEGTFRHGRGTARCAGGGAEFVYAVRHGRWRAVLGAQEPFGCDELRHFDVPDQVGGPSCFAADGELVDYHLATAR